MSRTLSEDQKRKMKEGRERKAAERKAALEAKVIDLTETRPEWTDDQKQAARDAYVQKGEAVKASDAKERIRVPIGAQRDVTAVKNQDPNYHYRWVNDTPGRIETFKNAGYVHDENASVGDSRVDGTHDQNGVVSRDMGKGTNSYLMKQRREDYESDQAEKQKLVDETEESMRRDKNDDRNDGRYGEIKIG